MASENLDFLQEFIDNTSELIFMLSIEGEFLFINNAFIDRIGFSRSELKNKKFEDIIHPEFTESILANLEKVKNSETPTVKEYILWAK
jgi:PAS domain S-box-containing protein